MANQSQQSCQNVVRPDGEQPASRSECGEDGAPGARFGIAGSRGEGRAVLLPVRQCYWRELPNVPRMPASVA